MPIGPLPEFDGVDDALKRRDFVLWVKKTLGHLVGEADREYWPVFVPDLIGPMAEAWSEAEPDFDVLADSVANLGPGQVLRHGAWGSATEIQAGDGSILGAKIHRPAIHRAQPGGEGHFEVAVERHQYFADEPRERGWSRYGIARDERRREECDRGG